MRASEADHHLDALLGRSMATTQDWSVRDIDALAALARAFAELDRAGVPTPLCPHELAWALFFDRSTRTKSAWAGAAARLAMHPVIVDGSTTQVAHGETAVETGAMLGMNAHAMGVRNDQIIGEGNAFIRDVTRGIEEYLMATGDQRAVPVVNLQCDIDHPTQSMADLLWLEDRFGDAGGLAGRKITISWAYSPSYAKPLSVAQGLVSLLTRFGAEITLAHPPGYELMGDVMDAARSNAGERGGSLRVVDDMDEAFRDADVVYPKSWGSHDVMADRIAAHAAGDERALGAIEQHGLEQNARFNDWICDERRMALTSDALYMHCLPADIGAEVTPGVMERFKVEVAREAQWKMYVIMAMIAGAKVPDLASRLRKMSDDAALGQLRKEPR